MNQQPTGNPPAPVNWLARQPRAFFVIWAVVAAFSAYVCMYAFRKPFSAAQFEGVKVGELEFKALAAVAQLIGYTCSKFLGIKFVSEAKPGRRIAMIALFIALAEGGLLLFATLPSPWNLAGLFLNGLPLGMVWGLIFSFLEGRRVTELLGLGLSISVIFSSGWVKSIGKWTMSHWGLTEFWMPFVTGGLFIPLLIVALWMLAQLPPPTPEDIAARTKRQPMNGAARRAFVREHWVGVVLLVGAYLLLMTYRDLRDTFMVNILAESHVAIKDGVFAMIEDYVGLAVMVLLCVLVFFRDNRAALWCNAVLVAGGALLLGAATWLHTAGRLGPEGWFIGTGIGLYIGYVPFQSLMFDRLLAVLRSPGTVVFLMAVGDSFGYLSTISLYLTKTFTSAKLPWSVLLIDGSYFLAAVVPVCILGCAYYFTNVKAKSAAPAMPVPVPQT